MHRYQKLFFLPLLLFVLACGGENAETEEIEKEAERSAEKAADRSLDKLNRSEGEDSSETDSSAH